MHAFESDILNEFVTNRLDFNESLKILRYLPITVANCIQNIIHVTSYQLFWSNWYIINTGLQYSSLNMCFEGVKSCQTSYK